MEFASPVLEQPLVLMPEFWNCQILVGALGQLLVGRQDSNPRAVCARVGRGCPGLGATEPQAWPCHPSPAGTEEILEQLAGLLLGLAAVLGVNNL